jgi:hypothetical protein
MSKDEDRIDRLIQSVLNVDPVPGLESRIAERVRREARVRRMFIRRFAAGAGLASAVALVVLMIGFPQRESHSVGPALASKHIAKPAEVSTRVNNAPSSSQPLPVLSTGPSNMAPRTMGIAVGDPLAKVASSALPAEALSPPPLKDFSLGTATPPLITAALPDPDLPQFQIGAFSLSASNQGVAE